MRATHVVRCAYAVSRTLGAAALLLGAFAIGPAAAQTAARPGFWMDAGIGYGRLRLTCASCEGIVATTGAAYTVTLGLAPTQNVLLGVQGQQWSSAGQQMRSVVTIVQWYPWSAARFFVRGGVGVVQGNLSLTADTSGAHSARGTGVALTLAAGYDLALARHLAVAVQAAVHVAALGDLAVGGATANDVIAYVSRIGLALVWR